MTEFNYQPYDKVIIHEIIKSKKEYFQELVKKEGIKDLRWIDGVLFFFSSTDNYPHIIEDKKNNIRHWELLHFTKADDYIQTVNLFPDVKLTNNTGNDLVSEAIRWLKEQQIWKD